MPNKSFLSQELPLPREPPYSFSTNVVRGKNFVFKAPQGVNYDVNPTITGKLKKQYVETDDPSVQLLNRKEEFKATQDLFMVQNWKNQKFYTFQANKISGGNGNLESEINNSAILFDFNLPGDTCIKDIFFEFILLIRSTVPSSFQAADSAQAAFWIMELFSRIEYTFGNQDTFNTEFVDSTVNILSRKCLLSLNSKKPRNERILYLKHVGLPFSKNTPFTIDNMESIPLEEDEITQFNRFYTSVFGDKGIKRAGTNLFTYKKFTVPLTSLLPMFANQDFYLPKNQRLKLLLEMSRPYINYKIFNEDTNIPVYDQQFSNISDVPYLASAKLAFRSLEPHTINEDRFSFKTTFPYYDTGRPLFIKANGTDKYFFQYPFDLDDFLPQYFMIFFTLVQGDLLLWNYSLQKRPIESHGGARRINRKHDFAGGFILDKIKIDDGRNVLYDNKLGSVYEAAFTPNTKNGVTEPIADFNYQSPEYAYNLLTDNKKDNSDNLRILGSLNQINMNHIRPFLISLNPNEELSAHSTNFPRGQAMNLNFSIVVKSQYYDEELDIAREFMPQEYAIVVIPIVNRLGISSSDGGFRTLSLKESLSIPLMQ